MHISTILLPVDGSTHSEYATRYAGDMAQSLDARIILLHVRQPIPPELGEPNLSHMLAAQESAANELLKNYEDMLEGFKVTYTSMIIGGDVAEVITDTAEAEKADIVVMGSRGKTDLQGLILGSVTHKVLHTAECPVLVVK